MVGAVQWLGGNLEEVLSLAALTLDPLDAKQKVVMGGYDSLLIHARDGTMKADLKDWIIRGVKGELYPVKDAIFQETYDLVEDAI